ncbi:sugar ABC transporter ATP-binding protein [Taklimakanibacter albus]|uniref:Sugar ABC transporter ATP-binding protein n=1 Tax=Taklimakanibacter albus TaxID=2800327 RepID=A0ACC5QZP3_9HYPH|nr:sugar ABC transporter ATP-binding protein [Aestuariivirga sp. YIM B02566]MBK1865833.1 sugar ABC transporter ATP-binding protein [Aestuariivirga sp. YIM B02566]
MNAPSSIPALEVRGVSKSFPGVKALDNVSFTIKRNEVVGLIGENGAGKTSLLKVLNGIYQPDEGELLVDGRPVKLASPRQAFDTGIAMVFQEQTILPSLTVAQNIFLGREEEFLRFGLVSKARMNEAAAVELKKVHLDIHPGTACVKLSFADRQMVEIAKALSLDSRITGNITILLDEPTSVLERKEVELLFAIIADLKKRASIAFISHRLDEVLAVSDRVYVMRDGKVVKEFDGKDVTEKDMHQHMVGRQLHTEYYREARQTACSDKVLIEARNLSKAGAFRNVSFALRAGEVLGIAGVIGSGREDLARCLAGHTKSDTGTLEVNGQRARFASVPQATAQGVGLVPAERKVEGLVAQFSVAENMTLAALPKFVAKGLLNFGAETAQAKSWIDRLKIKTPSPHAMTGGLSGGNQQKVVLAKWRIAGVKVLILDHPTRGIDVGAKEDVYELVRDMTSEGLAVILLGDTLEEVIGLSSRILVMRDGEVTASFEAPPGGKPTQIDLVQHMV